MLTKEELFKQELLKFVEVWKDTPGRPGVVAFADAVTRTPTELMARVSGCISDYASGFEKLWAAGRLHYTLEALVSDERFADLFDKSLRRKAAARIKR